MKQTPNLQVINVVHEYVIRGYRISFNRKFKTTVVTVTKRGMSTQFNYIGFGVMDFEEKMKLATKKINSGIII